MAQICLMGYMLQKTVILRDLFYDSEESDLRFLIILLLIAVAERSKVWTVFARLETGIVGSNRTQGMDVWCVYVSVFVLSYV
jgi:hypothetical protein